MSYLELAVALFEVVLLFGLSIPLWADWVRVGSAEGNPEAVQIRVVAQQFQWNMQYPGADGKFGRLRPELVDESMLNVLGQDMSDPNGADDIVSVNQLLVPKGRPVIVNITTKDVIHSFFLPEFRVKQDAIPGESIAVGFEATKTSEEYRTETAQRRPGKFASAAEVPELEIACAQLCGGQHYRMKGYLRILSEEDWAKAQDVAGFNTWVREHPMAPIK